MRERTEVMSGRFTPRERKAIEGEAKKQGLDVATYVRSAVMASMVLDGNKEAMRITADLVHQRLSAWVRDKSLQTLGEVTA